MKHLLFLIFPFCFLSAFPQQLIFRHYTVDDGLPSSEVYDVLQDSKGYMWFATDAGISRFNGYSFKNYGNDEGISEGVFLKIFEDSKKKIWFLQLDCSLYYFEDGAFHEYQYNEKLKSAFRSYEKIQPDFYIDSNENIWLGMSRYGHFKMTPAGNIIAGKQDFGTAYIREIDNEGFIFSSVDRIKVNHRNHFGMFGEDSLFQTLISLDGLPSFHRMDTNKFIMSTGDRIYRFDKKSVIEILRVGKKVSKIFVDNDFTLWVSLNSGGVEVYPLDKVKSKPVQVLDQLNVTDITQDHEGNIWMTTLENGVFVVPDLNILTYASGNGLASDKINAVLRIGDQLWVGQDNGIINIKRGVSFETIDLKSKGINQVNYLFKDSKEKIWIGGEGYLVNSENERFNVYKVKGFEPVKLSVKEIIETKNGRILIGNSKHILAVDQGHLEIVGKNKWVRQKADSLRVSCLKEESDSIIWFGNLMGLWKYDGKKFANIGKQHYLLGKRIDDIEIDQDGKLWLASKEAGVIIFSKDTIIQINHEKGLSTNKCISIALKNGDAWIGTKNGINRLKIKSWHPFVFETEHYTIHDGLASNEINQIKIYNDTLYAATNRGLTFFNVNAVQPNHTPPGIQIEKLTINESDTNLFQNYELNYVQNFIKISYVGLGYKNAGNLSYKYKMDGIDREWVYTKNTTIQYPKLPPGEYQFTVSAMNEDGYWSIAPATVSFMIAPPWWATWWFRIAAGVFAVSAIWTGFYFRYEALKRRTQLQQTASEAEQKALRAQMNPHFIFNALGSIQQFILQNNAKEAYSYLSKFAKLMRSILDRSRETFVPFEDEVRSLELYMSLEALRTEFKFEYAVDVDEKINQEDIEIPGMIVQPYIENAIWHGIMNKKGKGKIEVRFVRESDQLIKCLVEDDGVGRTKAKELKAIQGNKKHKSVGMQVTRQRLELLKEKLNVNLDVKIVDLKDDEGNVAGTQVEIMLPLINMLDT